eukprot:15347724-Ditylum_brightwellii.AAC.1
MEKDTLLLCNSLYELKCGKDTVNYLHAAAFFPCIKTWKKAITAGYFTTWPGLTVDMVNKYLDKSMSTAKGHLAQQCQNFRSTMKMTSISPSDNDKDQEEEPCEQIEEHTNHVYVRIMNPDEDVGTSNIFTDQTGKFPWKLSRGNQYILVLYKYDGNEILAEPIKNRTPGEITRAFNVLHAYLCKRGLKPRSQVLNNDALA